MKESITVIGVKPDTQEQELTFEYNDNVITAYWEPEWDGQPMCDRELFSIDYKGNFYEAIERMKEIWGND